MNNYLILQVSPSKDYELLDSGENEKLERYGEYIFRRPDPQALWPKKLSKNIWDNADAKFTTAWIFKKNLTKRWKIDLDGLKFWVKPTTFKHVGVFPEQLSNWKWIQEQITKSKRKIEVLNLFGYTGGAALAALRAGANVCHVDGSRTAITWARENAELSNLKDKPVRWILDDALKFLQREVKRGRKYDGFIMDPPAFGHGAKGEIWKIEKDFLTLLDLCKALLSENPLFFLINGYASGYSAIAYENNLKWIFKDFKGTFEKGELTIQEKNGDRILPSGIFARFSSLL